jgi:putative methionine-R-sulfoxide reductase with GAF domain
VLAEDRIAADVVGADLGRGICAAAEGDEQGQVADDVASEVVANPSAIQRSS